jgi:hypothetical protein
MRIDDVGICVLMMRIDDVGLGIRAHNLSM